MDINQSPLSRYKGNKSGITGPASEARATAEAARSKEAKGSNATSAVKGQEYREGQLLKGQVLDSRYNEVKLQLEPGKQVVTARLSGDVMLSIGQEARFVVTEDNPDQLILKYLPNETEAPVDGAVLKALSASGLPLTQRNKAIVSELLNQSMPVDKQTLQYLIKMSVTNRGAAPQTLVLMLKNNIPMTTENIRQFEAYQNGTHQLLSDIHKIATETTDLLRQTTTIPDTSLNSAQPEARLGSDAVQEILLTTDQPTSGLLTESVTDTDNRLQIILQINQELTEILLDTSGSASSSSGQIALQQLITPEELTHLYKALEQRLDTASALPAGMSPDILKQLKNGTLSLSDTLKLLSSFSDTGELLSSVSDLKELQASLVQDALYSGEPVKLSDILNPADRLLLSDLLPSSPETEAFKERISQGTASLKETLTFIREYLAQTDQKTAAELLASPQYRKLLEDSLLQKWTISPEKLAKKKPVQDLYRQLNEDIERLNSVIKSDTNTEKMQRLQEPAKNLQENLHFIKDLNSMFAYLQLPVQFRDREVHTDLYVFTRKKSLKENDSLSILLHLTMENLGSLNVHIQLKSNELTADFYTENKESGNLIKDNLPLLTKALTDKGYTVWANVKEDYQKPDFSKDFIEQNASDHNVQRYTFDVRT